MTRLKKVLGDMVNHARIDFSRRLNTCKKMGLSPTDNLYVLLNFEA